jgi:hypothetical protein
MTADQVNGNASDASVAAITEGVKAITVGELSFQGFEV